MALGPKELGSWANRPTLSTPNSGEVASSGGRSGSSKCHRKEYEEFKETRGRACEQPSGIAWYQKESKSAITAKILLTLLLVLLVLLHPLRASAMGRAFGGWSCGRRWPGGGGFGFGGRCVLLQLVENFQGVVGGR